MVAIKECKFLMADFVKQAISPDSFYRFELPDTKFGRLGWAKAGLCPFHADSRAGSFFINTESGAYCCFSCGAKGGDIIAFTRERYGLSFSEALHKLAEDWGLS